MVEVPAIEESNSHSSSALIRHKAAVSRISTQVAQFHKARTPFRIFHGNTNSTRPSIRTLSETVDISDLDHVISVDTERRTCLVEPNVPMDLLVASTLPLGLVCPVVPEFPGITVGGGHAGTAGESSSFRHGFFDRCINWFEMVLADGQVVIASSEEGSERKDLFDGAAGTFGTLGVATLFEIRLVPAKTYVELTYLTVKSIEDAQREMAEQAEDKTVDFLDGIMFSPDAGVIMAGRYAEQEDEKSQNLPVVTFTGPWDEWFYMHAESQLKSIKTASPSEQYRRELVPLTDYLFRYDRGAFWTGRWAFEYFYAPFTRLTRYLFDYCFHTRVMYHALHRSGLMQRFIIQDMVIPNRNVPAFSHWLDAELPVIYPRWLCPLKLNESVSMHPHSAPAATTRDDILLNIGVWGPTPPQHTQIGINRKIEAKLASLSGMKWLYAQTFYTEDEFWAIYDRRWYEALRKKYHAEDLPTVYEKVRTKVDEKDLLFGGGRGAKIGVEKGFWSIWPFAGVFGVLSVFKGGKDYLRKG